MIYGITTGFGALCNVTISKKDTRRLQENILMSHAAGVGNPLPEPVVRAIMALRVHDLCLGYSGCRMETIRYLLAFFKPRGYTGGTGEGIGGCQW